ncbi:hypothetical protein BH18ACT17_BH18ACT17_08720 [soil metagenome]
MPAGKVLVVIIVALLTWGVLYAPSLKRASEAQPLGTRRTVSLWVLRPVAAISDFVQLTSATDGASRALGRDPNAAPGGTLDVPEPDALPTLDPSASTSPQPVEPVVKDSKIRRPSSTNELRVVVVGDSLAAGLGVYLEREFRAALVRLSRQGRISTGLSRLDYFDWMTAMRQIESSYSPDLVIVMIGDNDNQSLQGPGGATIAEIGSSEWPPGYEDRVEEFTRIAVDGGAHVAWVGLPIVQRKERWDFIQRQNDIFERVVDATPNAAYVDTWDRFATRDGEYTPFSFEDGLAEVVRATDGLHFTPRGYELLAEAVTGVVVEEFRLTPNALED